MRGPEVQARPQGDASTGSAIESLGLYASAAAASKAGSSNDLSNYRVLSLPADRSLFAGDTRPNPTPFPADNEKAADNSNNGRSYRITAEGVNARGTPIVFVNGINTDLVTAHQTAAELSSITGRPVDLIYNASDPIAGVLQTAGHFGIEGAETSSRMGLGPTSGAVGNILGSAVTPRAAEWAKDNVLPNPPAANVAAEQILDQLSATEASGAPVRVVGYSQGAAITAEALGKVNEHLTQTMGADKAEETMGRVHVMTLGGASNRQDYASSNVTNVTAITHDNDLISQYFGENRAAPGQATGENPLEILQRTADATTLAQHLNYLPGMAGGHSAGDPAVDRAIDQWMQKNGGHGQTLRVLDNFEG